MSIDPNELKSVAQFLESRKALILDPSKSSRPAIRKLMSTLGIKNNNIEIAETYEDAEKFVNTAKPDVIWCEYDLPKKSGIDLLTLFKTVRPSRLDTVFIILSEKNSPVIASRAAEEDADALIIRPFTFDAIQSKFIEVLRGKINPSPAAKIVEQAKTLIQEKKFEDAIKLLEEAKAKDPTPALACYHLSEAFRALGRIDSAQAALTDGLSKNPKHYKCLSGYFEVCIETKNFEKAYETGATLFLEYPANPKYIAKMIWLAVVNKKYEDILGFYNSYLTIENPDEVLSNYVSAGLIIAGKHSLNQKNAAEGVQIFKKADVITKSKPSIMKEIILSLLSHDLLSEAQAFLSKASDDVRNSSDVIISEFISASKTLSSADALQRGLELYKQGMKSAGLFEILIKKSVELKRGANTLDDLVSAAIQAYPQQKTHFESLLKS